MTGENNPSRVADGRAVDPDQDARHREGVSVMQKLVTIRLEAPAMFSPAKRHGAVEEHLQQYLDDGWTISSVTGYGEYCGGWVIITLEKESK
jgi:hypothetical protein